MGLRWVGHADHHLLSVSRWCGITVCCIRIACIRPLRFTPIHLPYRYVSAPGRERSPEHREIFVVSIASFVCCAVYTTFNTAPPTACAPAPRFQPAAAGNAWPWASRSCVSRSFARDFTRTRATPASCATDSDAPCARPTPTSDVGAPRDGRKPRSSPRSAWTLRGYNSWLDSSCVTRLNGRRRGGGNR